MQCLTFFGGVCGGGNILELRGVCGVCGEAGRGLSGLDKLS